MKANTERSKYWGRYCDAGNPLLLLQVLILPAAIIPVMSWFLVPSVLQLLTGIILYERCVSPLPFYSFVQSFIYISMNALLFILSFGADSNTIIICFCCYFFSLAINSSFRLVPSTRIHFPQFKKLLSYFLAP